MRFYLEGRNKSQFFDFIQGDLEASLEKLNKRNEEDWQLYLEVDGFGAIHLGDRFFKYKQDVNSLRDAVERHFSKVINQIEAGLPDVTDEEEKTEDDVDKYNAATTWTCPTCTNINQMNVEVCAICKTKKPKILSNFKAF